MIKSPIEIVQLMMEKDSFSQWLGIEVVTIGKGNAVLSMIVRDDMTNGFLIAHGGITYSLADSALAFASNAYGFKAVSIETSISHLKKVSVNDCLNASCVEIFRGRTIAKYEIRVHNQHQELVAYFLGTVSISSKEW